MDNKVKSKWIPHFLGEFLGTFILVFFGCGSVGATILFDAHMGLFQIAIIWGIGIMLAIYLTRHLSDAHLNPAVTLAMVIGKRKRAKSIPLYWTAQFLGAFTSAAFLYFLLHPGIDAYEAQHEIVRGSAASIKTAMMFGEFYPNPGVKLPMQLSPWMAFLAEATGTLILTFFIFGLTDSSNTGKPSNHSAPVFIGLTVTILISIIAPLTQGGFNPARDLAPRLFSYMAGWGNIAWPDAVGGAFWIYVCGPIVGASIAAFISSRWLEPAFRKASD